MPQAPQCPAIKSLRSRTERVLFACNSTESLAFIQIQRPESYWIAARNPLEAALRSVKGRNRREMIRDCHEAGRLEQLRAVALHIEPISTFLLLPAQFFQEQLLYPFMER
jgi:hypothetical protein